MTAPRPSDLPAANPSYTPAPPMPDGSADDTVVMPRLADEAAAKPLVTPRGRFPHVRVVNGFIFVSGTSSRQVDNTIAGAKADALGTTSLDIREQTRAVIENIRHVLSTVGAGLEELVQITTYLVNMNDFGGYNEVYGTYFDEGGPTRTTVAVHQLPHPHLLIEMQAIAVARE
jgi:2-aminomuconate deaminase